MHSQLTFAIVIWAGTFDTFIDKIQICQNKIVRHLFKARLNYCSTSEIYRQTEMLKVKDLHLFECCKVVYQALFNNKFLPLMQLLNHLRWNHNYATRDINTFRLPKVKTNRDKFDFLFQCISHWNSLPNEIRCAPSFNNFKQLLKNRLLRDY